MKQAARRKTGRKLVEAQVNRPAKSIRAFGSQEEKNGEIGGIRSRPT